MLIYATETTGGRPPFLQQRLPYVEELWLYPGTAEVLCSACAPPPGATEHIPRLRARVYVVEGGLSAPKPAALATAAGSGLNEPSCFSVVEENNSSSQSPASSLSDGRSLRHQKVAL